MTVPKRLPILMYHKISETAQDDLTVTASSFEAHLLHIQAQGYTPIWCIDIANFIECQTPLPEKPIVISFDDGYQNNHDLAYPLLKKFGFKATIFLPVKFIGKTNVWDGGGEPLMTYDTMLNMTDLIEFGMHSYAHLDYRTLSFNDIRADVERCVSELQHHRFPYSPVFAYPYGGLPKDDSIKINLKQLFEQQGIRLAMRIKGETNRLPIQDSFELRRIGISGLDSLLRFKLKLWSGRARWV